MFTECSLNVLFPPSQADDFRSFQRSVNNPIPMPTTLSDLNERIKAFEHANR
jgi:hypothetical protein